MPKATYGTVAGIAGPISRIVRGAVLPGDDVESKAVLDTFYDAGGNCFDTAFIYHDGYSERFLGCWVERRNIRDDVVVIGKGAHTPNCDPVSMRNELSVSLERLRTDYVDLYMLHSDNLAVPVGEFVEALNEEVLGGRVRAFGASNWSMARLDAAVTYAQTHGLIPFSVLSNHFSLATMSDPPWEGCLDCADAAFVEWLTVHQLPNFAWSSQARGLFVEERVAPDAGSWAIKENLDRRSRAATLGLKQGVPATAIALAYVVVGTVSLIRHDWVAHAGPDTRRLEGLRRIAVALRPSFVKNGRQGWGGGVMSQVPAEVCNPLSRSAHHLRASGDCKRWICDVHIQFFTTLAAIS